MEFIINGDISDTELSNRIKDSMPEFYTKEDVYYNLIICFSIEALLKDEYLNSHSEEEDLKKRIYDLLGYQLREIDKVLCEQGIDIISSHIQGVRSQETNTIKIQIQENLDEVIFKTKKGTKSKRKPMKTFVTAPDLDFAQETVSSFATKELARIYSELLRVMPNKKFMSEVLGIDPTENDELLFEAFWNQYKDLWLATGNKRKILFNKLRHHIELAMVKHSTEDNIH
ncbi:hypothetical protein E2R58_15225 [Paenibacillus amylolyticus]|uniref:hypothetical protein n=1 Tax=Paenibacillus amylolyticus TaxID=1451 RepID=UPI0010594783|nr:hypothetical protein [Paenibacillus amylolyticus]TDL70430.1 hypothetical protein E2R58_15225 [Paenibacillus amylolyticus]